MPRRLVILAYNEKGFPVGETHYNARISNAMVDLIRERHEDDGLGYRRIAKELGIAYTTVRKICTYDRRAQTPERYKRVYVNA